MAFVENFTGSQNSGTPTICTFVDTSTGTDAAITKRRIFLLQSDGTYLTGDGIVNYDDWVLADTSISLDVLSQDTALNVTVQWLNVSNVVLYTKTIAYGFAAFGENFYYGLTLSQVPITFPAIQLSTNYWQNKMKFRELLDDAAQAISFASDTYAAQICYDADQEMITNSSKYF